MARHRKPRRRQPRQQQPLSGLLRQSGRPPRVHQPEVEYPIGTVAYYGPDDKTVTKIAVGVIESDEAEPIMRRWIGPGVATDPAVGQQIATFLQSHGVRKVAMTDRPMGCPHEEGIDFPEGQECPYCPFWRGKQGIQVR